MTETTGFGRQVPTGFRNFAVSGEINKSKRDDELLQDIRTWLAPPDHMKITTLPENLDMAELEHGDSWRSLLEMEIFWHKVTLMDTRPGQTSVFRAPGTFSYPPFLRMQPEQGRVSCLPPSSRIFVVCALQDWPHWSSFCDFREDQKKDSVAYYPLSSFSSAINPMSTSAFFPISMRRTAAYGNGSQHATDSKIQRCLLRIPEHPGQAMAYIVIDDLDECPTTTGAPSSREGVLVLVRELVGLQIPNLRICVTSRSDADIEVVLDPLALYSFPYMTRADTSRTLRNMSTDGVWVACQLEYLRRCLRQHIRRALDELLETFDATYDRTLEDIGEENWERVHRLFQCVSAASCPLRIKELAEFLAFDLSSETYRDDWRDGNPARSVLTTVRAPVYLRRRRG